MVAKQTDFRDEASRSESDVATALATAQAAASQAASAMNAAAASRVDLGSAAITFNSILAVSLGVRTVTVALATAKVGDRVYVHRTAAWAAGYGLLGNGYVPAEGQVEVQLLTPAVTLAQGATLPARFIAFRP